MGQLVPDIDFRRIRGINGSRRTGFEELCCQAAELEKHRVSELAGARYYRKAGEGGDAGVESYYALCNGDEWGWQAKYLFRLGQKQWDEMDRSVASALEKHPRLVRYIICLPIDLSEARKKKELSQRDHWNRHVEKWTRWAVAKGHRIQFENWGAFELRQRLTERAQESAGYLYYWFDERLFTDNWFQSRLSETIDNAGPRYTPELHVELPISKSFDAFGRARAFSERIESLYDDLLRKWKKVKPWPILNQRLPEIIESVENVGRHTNELASHLTMCADQSFGVIDFERIRGIAKEVMGATEDCRKIVDKKKSEKKDGDSRKSANGRYVPSISESASALTYGLRELDDVVAEIIDFTLSDDARISNQSVLILSGEAGTGKTHLMCDVARRRLEQGLPTVLLLGQDFVATRGPWLQIVDGLHLSDMSPEKFLGALDTAGQVAGHRSLIMIDALNEGEGIDLWPNHLRGMRQMLQNFPRVILAVSCRDTYEAAIIPKEILVQGEAARVIHRGFEGHEYDATRVFFSAHNIESPGGPLLVPEFSNPLFLKLLTKGLQNMGFKKLPKGSQGITRLFNFFIGSVDHKLARKLGYDEDDHLVRRAVEALARRLADKDNPWLEKTEAKQTVGAIRPEPQGIEYERTLYRNLIHEGLLMEDLHWISYNPVDRIQITRFAYERLSNHLVVSHWLKEVSDSQSLSKTCLAIPSLAQLVSDESFARRHAGWLYALSIQAPERAGLELVEIFPSVKGWGIYQEAFLSSLIWRDPKIATEVGKQYLYDLWRDSRFTDSVYDVMLMVATEPEHSFNSISLHRHLSGFSIPDRDAVWSIYLHENYDEDGPIDRLIEWAREDQDKSSIDDDVLRLAGIAIAWFFTSANRFLRDRATKAMVRLFEHRIGILRLVLKEFLKVNDPYVAERLYAVAYGCAMRTADNSALRDLAQDVYRWVFKANQPPPHILLRDYARGVIERALYCGADLNISIRKVRPPYRSNWPSFDIPKSDELDKWREWKEGMRDQEWARVHLHDSVMGVGISDFSHYVVGHLDEWSSERIDVSHKPTHRELYDEFVESLTKKQRTAWDLYWEACRIVADYRRLSLDERKKFNQYQPTETELDSLIARAESNLAKALGKNSKKYRCFRDSVLPYADEPSKYHEENRFDAHLARRWMMKRIIALGWTVELFGEFDRNVNRYGPYHRDAHKPERIGKKYQWIAYHELLARLSDNFRINGERLPDRRVSYHGPWDIGHVRDIDPSNLLPQTFHEEWSPNTNTWWFPTKFEAWDQPADKIQWLQRSDNLPHAKEIMEITDPSDGSEWLTLSGSYHWEQPTQLGEDRYEQERRQLWYILNSYLVRTAEINSLRKWAATQNWFGGWMPESQTFHEIFLGEFCWSPAFQDIDCYYYGHEGWTRRDDRIPVEILLTSETYLQESNGFDCSIDENILIELPCKLMIDGMNLVWNGVEGEWHDSDGQLVAYDPSVKSRGPRALIFRRDTLLKFLHQQGLTLFWTLIGERQILGGLTSRADYSGTMEINGTYFLKGNTVSGKKIARYLSPGDQRRGS